MIFALKIVKTSTAFQRKLRGDIEKRRLMCFLDYSSLKNAALFELSKFTGALTRNLRHLGFSRFPKLGRGYAALPKYALVDANAAS